jgi:hypothetical protein
VVRVVRGPSILLLRFKEIEEHDFSPPGLRESLSDPCDPRRPWANMAGSDFSRRFLLTLELQPLDPCAVDAADATAQLPVALGLQALQENVIPAGLKFDWMPIGLR